MKFLLRQGLGFSTIHQIGDYLRSRGAGHHWIDRYRVSDAADEAILRNEFSDLLDAVGDAETNRTRRR